MLRNFLFVLILLLSTGLPAMAQRSEAGLWTPISGSLRQDPAGVSFQQARWFMLDLVGLQQTLQPLLSANTSSGTREMVLPLPDGTWQRFRVELSSVMEPVLASRFPGIRSFRGVGVDNAAYQTHFDWSVNGFNAVIQCPTGRVYIDPLITPASGPTQYVVYFQQDVRTAAELTIACGQTPLEAAEIIPDMARPSSAGSTRSANVDLRTYRLALACTGEYARAKGGTLESVLGTYNTMVNRVNQILERDAGIRLVLANNTDQLIFLDPASDPFAEATNLTQLLNQNPMIINDRIGVDGYDVGHIFTSGCGSGVVGVATRGNVCTSGKGRGVTCHYSNNLGVIAINVFAHELGHQFNCFHSFNACTGNEDNVVPSEGFEPGGGSTIMSYANACGPDNFQASADDYFHAGSLDDFLPFITSGAGAGCGTLTPTENNTPTLQLAIPTGLSIPQSTPFRLAAVGNDDNQEDILTYSWEQMDAGPAVPLGEPRSTAPLFRSYPPTSSPERVFPRWVDILGNVKGPAEVLPTYARKLNFRCTVRDNHPGRGATAVANVQLNVVEQAGPFVVTHPSSPSDSWIVGKVVEVRWDVANTHVAPVNCQFVDIRLSTDGGQTFPLLLAINTPNDGSAEVTVPNLPGNQARIMVAAADNIFFAVSKTNFQIQAPSQPGFVFDAQPSGSPLICLPGQANFFITTAGFLGYDSLITLGVAGNVPPQANLSFSQNPIRPGENSIFSIKLPNEGRDTFTFRITATSPGGATISREIYLQTLATDFSDLKQVTPTDGQNGIILSTNFSWTKLPTAEKYDFQLATNPRFAASDIVVEANALTQNTFTPTTFLTDNTLYYWRVRAQNTCLAGDYTLPATFHTASTACTSFENNTALTIPGQGTPTVESSIVVDRDGILSDVNVPIVRATYEFVRDLRVSLISPKGTQVVLFDQSCALTNRFILGFDDDAPANLICPPDDGIVFKPRQSLSAFKGENLRGTWKLRIQVVRSESITPGTLQSWKLEFCASSNPVNPILVNNDTLQVPPTLANTITTGQLLTQDESSNTDQLRYTLVTEPLAGVLTAYNVPLRTGDTFTQSTINGGDLRYANTDGNALLDSLSFIVEDGTGGFLPLTFFRIKMDKNAVVATNDPVDPTTALRIFPNPAGQEVFVDLGQPLSQKAQLRLWSLQGQQLAQWPMLPGESVTRLPLGTLPNGVYLLEIRSENLRRQGRVVIQQ